MPENEQPPWLDVPRRVTEENGFQGALLLMKNPNGTFGFAVHGLNHAECVEALSVAIHLVLSDHDRLVLGGAAGVHAQLTAEGILVSNKERQH